MDWHRKGGDIAVEAVEVLAKHGVNAELTIVGSTPPQKPKLPGVRVVPFIDKRRERGRRTFREILLESHFMIFPSRADCSPVALCEAAAYGIPVVASDVGGIRTVVTERNGRLLPSGSTANDYAAALLELMADEHRYRELVGSSRERYEEVLNWDTWSKSLLTFCKQLV
jgi:glycosyltransferase involved in cell wall biosynthesis